MTPSRYNRWLHRFAVLTACSTFLLVVAGGLVTSTDSGLAVPDWPLSYGQLMPPMVGGIFYEHGHRMVATFVGFLTTVLAFWLWKSEERKWVQRLGFVALAAVIAQGILGGLTVLFLLPTPISVAHATLAQSFFSLTIIIALVTSRGWHEGASSEAPVISHTLRLALSAVAAVFLQLIIGAWMRHSGAGLAIPDFPTTFGEVIPPPLSEGLARVNQFRMEWFDMPPVSLAQVWVHFSHRIGAVIAVTAVVICGVHIMRNYPREQRLREPALIMLILVISQFVLGALTVWTGKGVQITTIHVATGALLLGTTVFLCVRAFSLSRMPAQSVSPGFVPQAAKP